MSGYPVTIQFNTTHENARILIGLDSVLCGNLDIVSVGVLLTIFNAKIGVSLGCTKGGGYVAWTTGEGQMLLMDLAWTCKKIYDQAIEKLDDSHKAQYKKMWEGERGQDE